MKRASEPEVVVVTGGSAGVGRATVEAYARRGAKIGLLARGEDRLEATRRRVEELGGQAVAIPTDVADADAVNQAAERVEQEFGPIDVWINNAMVSVFAPISQISAEEFERVTQVTYLGVVHGTKAALERMRPRDRGSIIIVGSALAKRGIPLQAPYCAAKHAVQGFFESLRAELLHEGSHIKLSIVHLPALNTPQFDWVKSRLPNRAQPVPPIFEPEVAAEGIIHAQESGRREIYVGGPTVMTIIGNRLVAGFVDRYLAKNGFDSQQTDEPEDPGRLDNLWEPVPGDPGARGRFGTDRTRDHSLQLWATKHRTGLGIAAVAVGVVGGLIAGLRS